MNTRVITLSFLSLLLLFSCKKKDQSTETNTYIVGINTDGPVYWKNGTANDCVDCIVDWIEGTMANGIAVNKSDFYIPNKTGYLKNGVQINLPHATTVLGVAASGDNIYAVGWSDSFKFGTFYWKNGDIIQLPSQWIPYPPIFVALGGNNFYMTGKIKDSSGYWKNTTFNPLFFKEIINGIAVNKDDVYIIGADNLGHTGYWKNGVFQVLQNRNGLAVQGNITDISFDKDDVYVTLDASGPDFPLYWKNNVPVGEGITNMHPRSIVVRDDEVYVLFNKHISYPASPVSCDVYLWKNGILNMVSSNAVANKIAITK